MDGSVTYAGALMRQDSVLTQCVNSSPGYMHVF